MDGVSISLDKVVQQPLPKSNGSGQAGVRATAVPAEVKQAVPEPPVKVEVSQAEVDAARIKAVQQAARQYANTFAVSDVTFSIFKDTLGQFVVRVRSLKTGEITQIPEPDILKFLQAQSMKEGQFLDTQA